MDCIKAFGSKLIVSLYRYLLAFLAVLSFLFIWPAQVFAATPLGKPAPVFETVDIKGNKVSTETLKGKVVIFEWFNSECPYVVRIYKDDKTQKLQREALEKGVVWIVVNSTAESHKDFQSKEASEKIISDWKMAHSHFVIDADGKLGKLFGATSTPTYMIINKDGLVAYTGAVDNYPDGDDEPGKMKYYFEDALKEVLEGKPVSIAETKSYGCSVKYAK